MRGSARHVLWSYFRLVVPSSFIVLLALSAVAQRTADESSPELQRMFAEARDAQQRGQTALAVTRYLEITKAAPRFASAYNNLGMLYLESNNLAEAMTMLKRALELNPDLVSAKAMLGMTYFQLGNLDEAEPLLRTALNAKSTDDRAEMMLALILISRKEYVEASQHLSNFLKRNPNNQKGWYLLRHVGLQIADEAHAKVDAIDADSAIAHEIAGEIDEETQNFAGALAEYQRSADRDPNLPEAHMHLGDAYWHLGNWNQAASEYRRELARNGTNCVVHWRLADSILEGNGSSEEALVSLNSSISACPGLVQARVDRARALLRLRRAADAISDLLIAEKDRPAEPSVHYLLAQAYKATGEAGKAQQEMHTFQLLKDSSGQLISSRTIAPDSANEVK